jgi:tRNA pseudouridine38-40 synthase
MLGCWLLSTASLLPSHKLFHRSCDSRKYTYFFPTYLLIPPKPGTAFQYAYEQYTRSMQGVEPLDSSVHPFWSAGNSRSSSTTDDLVRKRSWRISTEQVEVIRQAAKKFEGTHNFHNFTVGREFGERSNQRHMWKLEVGLRARGWLPLRVSSW